MHDMKRLPVALLASALSGAPRVAGRAIDVGCYEGQSRALSIVVR